MASALMLLALGTAKAQDTLNVAPKTEPKINAIIKDYADGPLARLFGCGNGVRWLDFNAKFLTPEGELTKEVMNDLLHPNEKGYQIWLDAMLPTLKEICGK